MALCLSRRTKERNGDAEVVNEGFSLVQLVHIVHICSLLFQAPFFVETPRRRQAAIGQEIFLRCHAKGYPKPKISWTFNGSPIDLDGDDNLDQDPRGDLVG